MKSAAILMAGLACVALLRSLPARADSFVPVAHSAMVTLEAQSAPAYVILRARHTADASPLTVTELAVSVDGKTASTTHNADDTWLVALPAGSGARKLEVMVAHDGIREVLSGTVPAAAAGGGGAAHLWQDHKQMAWWILNITIVLIGVIAVSRRMS
jgi:hypothetical protein